MKCTSAKCHKKNGQYYHLYNPDNIADGRPYYTPEKIEAIMKDADKRKLIKVVLSMEKKYFDEFSKLGYFEKYDKKYFDEFEDEMANVITPIYNNWNILNESDIEILTKKLGKICRDETSLLRKTVLSDIELSKVLIEIGKKFNHNKTILSEVISSIDNMCRRYKLEITDEIFQFLIEQTSNKKVNFYISIFITETPQFQGYDKKWEYVMSIPKIAPKKKSIKTFYHAINNFLNELPPKYILETIKIFNNYLEANSNLHESTRTKYQEIIEKLKLQV